MLRFWLSATYVVRHTGTIPSSTGCGMASQASIQENPTAASGKRKKRAYLTQ